VSTKRQLRIDSVKTPQAEIDLALERAKQRSAYAEATGSRSQIIFEPEEARS
jgi:hypothetical protein